MTDHRSRWVRARLGGRALAAAAAVCAATSAAHAEGDLEIPALVFDVVDTAGVDDLDELDLANIVQSAVKNVTTVQEAPAIVTVVTADDIRAHGYQNIEQLLEAVPGWMRFRGQSDLTAPIVRGINQAMLYMHDGMSLYDPFFSVPSLWQVQPLENIKRVELVTGPGGVLWGANSFLGVMNVIGKGADDVDGVEAGISAGDGNGDRRALRGYLMAGVPRLFGPRSEAFLHASFETFDGPALELPSILYWAPVPQPSSPAIYGPLSRTAPARSMLFNLDGKVILGNLAVSFQAPFAEHHSPLGFGRFVVAKDRPADTLRLPDGTLACPFEEPYLDLMDRCLDKGRLARDNQLTFFDRYLLAEYRSRFADGAAGLTLKGYGVQFLRSYPHLGGLDAVPVLLEGGLSFGFDATSYRVGGAFEGDLELSKPVRLLYGAEAFHDWTPSDVERARQGDGVEAVFIAPLQLERLPLPCPQEPDPDDPGHARIVAGCPLTFSFPANRTVLGAYLNPQWRPGRGLILDAGARLQIAPAALGRQAYDLTPTFSANLVYKLAPQWHAKLGYTQGFRPPAFEHTNSNGEAAQLDGDLDLAVETSDALQAEINARLFKGQRSLRELDIRVDYSYTRVENYIQLVAGRYENTAERGMHSAEALAKLHVQGGHQLALGYTFLRMTTGDLGVHKALPEHWFNLAAIFAIGDAVTLSSNLRVVGAMEVPHLLVEYRGIAYDEAGGVVDAISGETTSLVVEPHELVLDRQPPGAELTLGVSYRPTARWRLSAFTYNTFDARAYQAEPAVSYEPRLKYVAVPYPDFSARLSIAYNY